MVVPVKLMAVLSDSNAVECGTFLCWCTVNRWYRLFTNDIEISRWLTRQLSNVIGMHWRNGGQISATEHKGCDTRICAASDIWYCPLNASGKRVLIFVKTNSSRTLRLSDARNSEETKLVAFINITQGWSHMFKHSIIKQLQALARSSRRYRQAVYNLRKWTRCVSGAYIIQHVYAWLKPLQGSIRV